MDSMMNEHDRKVSELEGQQKFFKVKNRENRLKTE